MREEDDSIAEQLAAAREALMLRERQMRTLVDNVPIVLGYADTEQRVRYANRAFQATSVLGRDVHGELVSDVLGEEAYRYARPAIERALSGERVTFQGEIEIRGEPRHREVTYVPDFDEGRIVGFFGIGYDVTERVRQERAIVAREEHLRRVLETMVEGVVIHGSDGRIIQANPAAARILGLTLEQVLGTSSMDPQWHVVHEDGSRYPGEQHPAMRTLRDGIPLRGEIMGVRYGDGPIRWISVNSEPIHDVDPRSLSGVLATFSDVTENRAALARIRDLMQRLDLAQENERRAIARALHEGVAQDLYAMRLMLRLLEGRARGNPEILESCAPLAEALAKAMGDLRQVAMDLQPLGLASVSLVEALRNHARFFGELTALDVNVEADEAIPELEGRVGLLLFRAAQEALTNVSRHARARHVQLRLSMIDDVIELRVTDDGVGIRAGDLDKPGSLGLLGLREKFQAAGGRLAARSISPRGTEIVVCVPRRPPEPA